MEELEAFSSEQSGLSLRFGEQFLSKDLVRLLVSVSLFKVQPEWNGTSCVWVLSIRLRNPRCPFGSTSVSAPRRDGLDR